MVVGTTHTRPGLRLELADPAAVSALVEAVSPEGIVHTAYSKDGPDAEAVVVAGSQAIARAGAAVGARLVHLSSDVVFSGRAGRPYTEDDPTDPVSRYGRAKAAAEPLVRAADPGAVLVRTSLLLGGRDAPGVHERLALDPEAVFWSDVVRCPLLVDDLARALLELVDLDVAGPLHVAGPDAVDRARLATLVTGRPVRSRPAPAQVSLDVRLDSSRATGLLRSRLRGAYEVLAHPPAPPEEA
jgi:dTDP-4-dehydrorhamnose reductase